MDTMFCYLKGCAKCGGDLIFDQGDWRCWQCGQYYYANRVAPAANSHPEPPEERALSVPQGPAPASPLPPEPEPSAQEERPRRKRRKGYGARAQRNINSVIRSRKASDDRWWARNRQIIEYLDQGLSIRAVAELVGRGERQIRTIRERLADFRAAGEEEPR